MGLTLYEITKELDELMNSCIDEETGEIDPEALDRLKELNIAKDQKIENCALVIKNLNAEADAIKAEAKKLTDRARQNAKKVEWLKEYISNALNGEKMTTARVSISYRKSKSVECSLDDITVLPKEFLRFGDPELNKTEIKKVIEAGGTVEGCSIVEKTSMQIK